MNERTYVEGFFKKSEHEEVIDKLEEINRRLKVLESGCLCPQYPYVYPYPYVPYSPYPWYPYDVPYYGHTQEIVGDSSCISI